MRSVEDVRGGVLVRDTESSFRELGSAGGRPIDDLLGHSIPYRVAMGQVQYVEQL